MKITAIFLLALAYLPTVASAPCTTLEECIDKGKEIMRGIREALRDKDGLPRKYAEGYKKLEKQETLSTEDNTGKDITDVMDGLPLTMPITLTKVTIEGKGDPIAFEHIYGKGIIVATAIYNRYDPVAEEKRVHWDVIAFEQYSRSAQLVPADLTYILQYKIDSSHTRVMFTTLYEKAGKESDTKAQVTDWLKWERPTDGFHALLGTPNGQGAGFLLIDYASTMGGRSIAAIYTRRFKSDWMMVMEFTKAETFDFIPSLSSFFDTQSYSVVRFIAGLLGIA